MKLIIASRKKLLHWRMRVISDEVLLPADVHAHEFSISNARNLIEHSSIDFLHAENLINHSSFNIFATQ